MKIHIKNKNTPTISLKFPPVEQGNVSAVFDLELAKQRCGKFNMAATILEINISNHKYLEDKEKFIFSMNNKGETF